jgi:type II secretory pathway pseudopilin PulG
MMRRASVNERGVTIVELTVVLMLMSIIGAVVYSVLVAATQVTARAGNSTTVEDNARTAMRTMSEDLRAALQIRGSSSTTACPTGSVFPAGFGNCVQFVVPHEVSLTTPSTTIAPGGQPLACPFSDITYGLRAGAIREDRVDYNASCEPKTILTGKVVLSGVDNTAAQPLFTFYDAFGNALGSANTMASYADAGSVLVQIWANYQKGAPDISFMTTAAFRNNR